MRASLWNGLRMASSRCRRCVEVVSGYSICDLDMPKLSGEEVLEHLSKIPGSPPALVISGYLDASSNRRLLSIPGVRLTLRKPFDVFAFARLVADICRGGSGAIPDELAPRVEIASRREEAAGG